METMHAFTRGQAATAAGNKQMVFDWDKAARLIAEIKPTTAAAGLRHDWEWTSGLIFENGAPVDKKDTYTYLSSNWAVPELDLDGDVITCFLLQEDSDEWDAETYWPQSALDILGV